MDIKSLEASINSPSGLQDGDRKWLHKAFADSFKPLEQKGIFAPLNSEGAYTTGPDIQVEAMFPEEVPLKDGMLMGDPITRRQISEQRRR